MVDKYDNKVFTAAWGNAAMIVGGPADQFKLPLLPPRYEWLLTRQTTDGSPTYCLALLHDACVDEGFEVIRRGQVDKNTQGEAGVVQLALEMKERHCPDRRSSPSSAPTESSETSAETARPSTVSERPRRGSA